MNSFFSPSKQIKGQGLVEYAIILALVAIVVIAVVRVMGPNVGNTFSTINNSLPGESAVIENDGDDEPDGWTFAANENEVVNVPSGNYEIQYGANGQYFYQYFTGPTTVNCNNATFGDPIVGTYKQCSVREQ